MTQLTFDAKLIDWHGTHHAPRDLWPAVRVAYRDTCYGSGGIVMLCQAALRHHGLEADVYGCLRADDPVWASGFAKINGVLCTFKMTMAFLYNFEDYTGDIKHVFSYTADSSWVHERSRAA